MLFTKLKLSLLITLISDVFHITGSTTCPNGMSPYDTGLCYSYHSETKSWSDANNYCKTKYDGALVIVNRAHTFTLITDLIKATSGLQIIWIGASDVDMDNSFNWNDGQQCCPNRWVPGQPDRSGHCLDMWRTSSGLIGFDDGSCSARFSFVCQASECKDIPNCIDGHVQCTGSSTSQHQCTQCDVGYRTGGLGKGCIACTPVPMCEQYMCVNETTSFCTKCSNGLKEINGGQFCYDADNPANHISNGEDIEYFVYIDDLVSWQKAEKICKFKGGNLFVPESSKMEQQLRLKLQSEFSSYTDYNFWIGVRLVNSTCTDWIGKGQTLFFARWGRKPATVTHELCVVIDQTHEYKMAASPCQRRNAFICQKKLTQDVTVG